MTDKKDKMQGRIVSKEEVIAQLGKPTVEWSRKARQHERQKFLTDGRIGLSIRGLKSCGERGGFIAFLEAELRCPTGWGTNLVTEEENAAIFLRATRETEAELKACRERLALLERSPDEVRRYLDDLRRWLDFARKMAALAPESEGDDFLDELNRESREAEMSDIAAHEAEVAAYEALLARLEASIS